MNPGPAHLSVSRPWKLLCIAVGPFNSDASLKLVKRKAAWTSKYAMLFIDNPVGAGFSFTTAPSGYCNDTKVCVASNLFSLLEQFYGVFPDLLKQERSCSAGHSNHGARAH